MVTDRLFDLNVLQSLSGHSDALTDGIFFSSRGLEELQAKPVK